MTRWALAVLLVLTAPIAFMGASTATDVVGALANGRPTEDYFSPNIPMRSVPLVFLPGWIAAVAWFVRLTRSKAAPSKTQSGLSAFFILILSAGVACIAALAAVIYLWTTTM